MVDKTKYIQRFKEIYKSKTGQDLDDALALEYFENLIALVSNIYVPLPRTRVHTS